MTRAYQNLVEDGTRVMRRLKALFRARGIRVPGRRGYHPATWAQWLARLPDRGVRFGAEELVVAWAQNSWGRWPADAGRRARSVARARGALP